LPHRLPTLVGNSSSGEDTAIPFDYLCGPDIVFVTCNSNAADASFTKHGQGESQQLCSIPKAPHCRANVVSDVSTLLLQLRCESISKSHAGHDLPGILKPILGTWNPPVGLNFTPTVRDPAKVSREVTHG